MPKINKFSSESTQKELSNSKKSKIKLDNDNLSIIGKISPVGIFRTDTQWKCSYVNDRWSEITGFSMQQALGDGWYEAIHPEDLEGLKQKWHSHSYSKTPITTEHRLLTVDRKQRWVLAQVVAETNDQGQLEGFIGSIIDITERKKASQALRESEELNRELVENSPNAILIQAKESKIVFANKAAANLLQAQGTRFLVGKSIYEFIPRKGLQILQQKTGETLRTGKTSAAFEQEVLGVNGSRKYIETIAVPFQWKGEKAILLVNRDITVQKHSLEKLESSEKQLRHFIQDAPVAVAMLDRDMNYIACSRLWLSNWWKKKKKITTDSIVGQNHYELFPDVTEYWKKVHKRALKGAYEANEEDYFVTEEGKAEWLRWEVRPWKSDDEIEGLIIYTEFITERKNAEKNLMLLADELMASNEELQQFAYITSHNLRAPIVNIDTLLSFYDPSQAMTEDNKQIFEKILLSFDQLKSSLNDLIKLVDLKKGQYTTKETVVFEDVLKKVLRNIETQIAAERAEIEYDFSRVPKVLFKSSVLESVLQNLVTNALKYRRDVTPKIAVKTDSADDYVTMTVRDNGMGLDLDKIGNKIFGMYQRFHEGIEGKGLGLYIVKSQVESLGGKIEVDSRVDRGTTFTVYIKK